MKTWSPTPIIPANQPILARLIRANPHNSARNDLTGSQRAYLEPISPVPNPTPSVDKPCMYYQRIRSLARGYSTSSWQHRPGEPAGIGLMGLMGLMRVNSLLATAIRANIIHFILSGFVRLQYRRAMRKFRVWPTALPIDLRSGEFIIHYSPLGGLPLWRSLLNAKCGIFWIGSIFLFFIFLEKEGLKVHLNNSTYWIWIIIRWENSS